MHGILTDLFLKSLRFLFRYIFYDVNPGEGFNLRRDVFMRVGIMVKKMNEQSNKYSYTLVSLIDCYVAIILLILIYCLFVFRFYLLGDRYIIGKPEKLEFKVEFLGRIFLTSLVFQDMSKVLI